MNYANNILETIGQTPLVKLNKLTLELPCLVLAKYETFTQVQHWYTPLVVGHALKAACL